MIQSLSPHVLSFLVDLVRLCIWLAILSAIFVPLERLFAVHPQKILRKGIAADLGYYYLNSLLPAVLMSAPLGFAAWAAHRLIPADVQATIAGAPFWARALAALLVGEIGVYWGHRWSHEIPWLWRFHAVHHSAEEVDFLVNTRAHPVDMVFGRLCGVIPIYVLGLGGPENAADNMLPVLITLTFTVWSFFIHANLRWRFGPLEWFVSTPHFHHWHHNLAAPAGRDHASILPFLDWCFGTFHLPKGEWPPAYGVKETMPGTLIGQLVQPLSQLQPSIAGPTPGSVAQR